MQRLASKIKASGKTIGFVPTMGFLHEGHLSLVRKSKVKCEITIVSIFVNPTQFAPNEDLAKYPRDIKRDKYLLTKEKVDYLFYPGVNEIYSKGFQTFIEVENITHYLEGQFRPTHFRGVTTVVAILLNSVMPDFAFFGQKDAQQAVIIKRMVKDLKLNLKVILCPIVRERDGLAMSSRNVYLSGKERSDALVLYRSLCMAELLIMDGKRNPGKIITQMKDEIYSVDTSKLDYISIVNSETFEPIEEKLTSGSYYILVACKIGTTRLIDNLLITIS